MPTKKNPREYGLGDPTPYVRGVPRVRGPAYDLPACPNCGCKTLYHIEVDVDHPMLVGRKGVGMYVGCPACPFASPMMMGSTRIMEGRANAS